MPNSAGPVVSVVLPTRNRGSLLPDAIQSVLSQSYEPIELIIVDDASTDGTCELLESDFGGDDRVRVLQSARRIGAAAARNRAIATARGSILAFQDSDTIWAEGRLERQVELLESSGPRTGVVYGYLEASPTAGSVRIPSATDTIRSGDLSRALPRHNIVDLPASVVRMEVVRSVGAFDERLPRYQDWELFLRIASDWDFLFDDQVAVRGRENTDRISHDRAAHFRALAVILAKHEELFAAIPAVEVAWRMQLLAHAVRGREVRQARLHLSKVVGHPLHILSWVAERWGGRPHVIDRSLDPCNHRSVRLK